MKRKILIVEDEQSIATLIEYNLQEANYETTIASDGEKALQLIKKESFDFVVLDIMLPKVNGIEVCTRLRRQGNNIPILMLTAKSEEENKVTGLQAGADDYLTKPFSPKELIARIEAIFRRIDKYTDNEQVDYIRIGDIKIDLVKYEVYVANTLIEFTKKEFDLLVYLAKHQGEIISREQMLYEVWGYDYAGDTRTVDMQVSRLRDKIEKNSKEPEYIKTVWGRGYRMENPT